MCKECRDELDPGMKMFADQKEPDGRRWIWVAVLLAILGVALLVVLTSCATNPKGVDTQGAPVAEIGTRLESPDITGADRTKGGRVGVQWGFQPNIEILPGGAVWLVAIVFGLLAILAFIFRVQASIYAAHRNAAFEAIEVAADTKSPAQMAKRIFEKQISGRWFGLLARFADAYLERVKYKGKK